MKSIMTASLTCHYWLRASQCLAVSKRICLKITMDETVLLFRHRSSVHRRFCTVKLEPGGLFGLDYRKLNLLWKKYSQNIRKIIFHKISAFCIISNALKNLKRLESVEIKYCKLSANKFKATYPKCEGNENIVSLVLDKSCFGQNHVNNFLSLTPNLTSIDWNNCAKLESKCLYTFLTENPLKLKRGLEFIEHIKYITYGGYYSHRDECKLKEILYRNLTPI